MDPVLGQALVANITKRGITVSRTRLDGALIAGDLGCFPDISKLDKATRRWIETDPEEAGFSRFFTQPQDVVESIFRPEHGDFSDVNCPILFVPGNHEDYEFIETRQRASGGRDTFTVDCYQRFHCLRDGAIFNLRGQDGNHLRIAGIWGIENTTPHAPYKIKPATVRKLAALKENSFDLLLTHDAPAGAYPTGGSQAVADVIKACKPKLHLFGHVHQVGGRHEYALPTIGTKSVLLKGVSFGKRMDENLAGTMGILDWAGANPNVELVKDDWLRRMRCGNWDQVWPQVAGEF